MSIWSSIGSDDGRHCRAEDHDQVELDVATATSWHSSIRLASMPRTSGLDFELVLSEQSAEVLRDWLSVALERVRSTRAHRRQQGSGNG